MSNVSVKNVNADGVKDGEVVKGKRYNTGG